MSCSAREGFIPFFFYFVYCSGTILKEDDGLIEPIDLVQLLLTNFLDTLNPDLFPEEDRPGII